LPSIDLPHSHGFNPFVTNLTRRANARGIHATSFGIARESRKERSSA